MQRRKSALLSQMESDPPRHSAAMPHTHRPTALAAMVRFRKTQMPSSGLSLYRQVELAEAELADSLGAAVAPLSPLMQQPSRPAPRLGSRSRLPRG
jgi:hypothetical protein